MVFANAFAGQARQPTDSEFAAALGASKAHWDALVSDLSAKHKLSREWQSSSKKLGWSLRLKRGERNIVYLSPYRGGFCASFALGDKAVEAARNAGLPRQFVKLNDAAKRYVEGTAIRIDVLGPENVDVVKKLTAIKLEH